MHLVFQIAADEVNSIKVDSLLISLRLTYGRAMTRKEINLYIYITFHSETKYTGTPVLICI